MLLWRPPPLQEPASWPCSAPGASHLRGAAASVRCGSLLLPWRACCSSPSSWRRWRAACRVARCAPCCARWASTPAMQHRNRCCRRVPAGAGCHIALGWGMAVNAGVSTWTGLLHGSWQWCSLLRGMLDAAKALDGCYACKHRKRSIEYFTAQPAGARIGCHTSEKAIAVTLQ